MDKYEGCNRVESVVSSPEKAQKGSAHSQRAKSFAVRMGIAAVIIGIFCFVRFVPIPWLGTVREVLRKVFCYDIFGRSVGTSPIFFKFG